MDTGTVELLIRLRNGKTVCERYNQREMAEFVQNTMLERIRHSMPVVCFDGEEIEIPASSVDRIEVVVPYEV